jgi:hypothetical protein
MGVHNPADVRERAIQLAVGWGVGRWPSIAGDDRTVHEGDDNHVGRPERGIRDAARFDRQDACLTIDCTHIAEGKDDQAGINEGVVQLTHSLAQLGVSGSDHAAPDTVSGTSAVVTPGALVSASLDGSAEGGGHRT